MPAWPHDRRSPALSNFHSRLPYTTYGNNPDKEFPLELSRAHLGANQWVANVEFKYGIPLREPLFFEFGTIAASFRDWSPLLGPDKTKFYMPLFSLSHEKYGTYLSLLNDYADPNVFMLEHLYFNLGRAQAEWAFKTGIEFNTPHHQNFLIELDENFRPTGRIIVRDFGDSHLNRQMVALLRQRLADCACIEKDGDYEFIIMDSSSGKNVPRWTGRSLGRDIPSYFANGIRAYRAEVDHLAPERLWPNNESNPFYMKLVDRGRTDLMGPVPSHQRDRRLYIDEPGERDQRMAERRQRVQKLQPSVAMLYELTGQALRGLVVGETVPDELFQRIQLQFKKIKTQVLALEGEIGDLLRSRLVWSGVWDLDLAIREVETSANSLEMQMLVDHFPKSKKLFEALIFRLARPTDFYSESFGMLHLRFRLHDWLAKSPTLSLEARTAALSIYLGHEAIGAKEEIVSSIFKNAQSITVRERQMLVDYIAKQSWVNPDNYKAVLSLPIAPTSCQLHLSDRYTADIGGEN